MHAPEQENAAISQIPEMITDSTISDSTSAPNPVIGKNGHIFVPQ